MVVFYVIHAQIKLKLHSPKASVRAHPRHRRRDGDNDPCAQANRVYRGERFANHTKLLKNNTEIMVLTQPNLTKATWHGIVEKMIHAYKAPVDAGEMAAIVDYLATTKGSE